ncbi:MAG TPA: family 1 encapsulin nanocompartment shell protein [Candidatus Izemoplasmatales bacterium]|nr:family 1 encapsulin nanocompartment shell protein [Candidatus Izemoplasmatales bacterium]
MDIFKRNLAPISDQAWEEVDERAEEVINAQLTTRKSLKVNGPFGLSYTSIPTGRLDLIENNSSKVKLGIYNNKSLLETRISFELSKWELDNLLRGAKDIELDALEDAAKVIARFEDDVIYNGSKNAGIAGLMQEAGIEKNIKLDSQEILSGISEALIDLKNAFVGGPFNFVVSRKVYNALNKVHGSKLLRMIVEEMIGGHVIVSEMITGGLLLPVEHDDLEFTIGQEYTIGYESHTDDMVKLFIMNSFTLRVLDDQILVKFNIK